VTGAGVTLDAVRNVSDVRSLQPGTPLLPWEKLSATWRADEGKSLTVVILPHPVGSANHLLPREKEGTGAGVLGVSECARGRDAVRGVSHVRELSVFFFF
jgi:hypothetical protein